MFRSECLIWSAIGVDLFEAEGAWNSYLSRTELFVDDEEPNLRVQTWTDILFCLSLLSILIDGLMIREE